MSSRSTIGRNRLRAVIPNFSARPEFAELLEEYGVNGLQLKFEVNIPSSNPWQSCALQVMFTGNDVVTYATGTNAYFSDTNVPRGLWLPLQREYGFV